jgi:hypothetical protein
MSEPHIGRPAYRPLGVPLVLGPVHPLGVDSEITDTAVATIVAAGELIGEGPLGRGFSIPAEPKAVDAG